MRIRQNCGWLDRFRMIAALLVITIHTSPLMSLNEEADFFLTRVLARIAVPFFLMVTGQFTASDFLTPSPGKGATLCRYLKKTALLYVFCILLYLPIGIYAGHYQEMNFGAALRMLLFDGTFYHLWYFPACILGMLVVYLMSRFLRLKAMTAVSVILYVIGLFGDSYFGLAQKVPALEAVYEFIFRISSYTRNGLFLAPLFLVLGIWMAKLDTSREEEPDEQVLPLSIMGLALSFSVMTMEAFVLRHFQFQRHDSMYVALIPTMFFLYQCLLCLPKKPAKVFRSASAWIYILHPAFIVVVRAIAKVLRQTELLVDNSIVHYLAVTLMSVAAGFGVVYLWNNILSGLFPSRDALPEECRAEKPPAEEACDGRMRKVSRRQRNGKTDGDAQEIELSENYSPRNEIMEDGMQINMENNLWETEPQENGDDNNPSIGKTAGKPAPRRSRAMAEKNAQQLVRPKKASPCSRAWIELDAAALAHNVSVLRSRLPQQCRLMPAVKADAYGHGAVLTARLLNQLDVNAFCVACLSEGVALREADVTGEILILGYTPPKDFPLLVHYRLTQAVIDYDYAKELADFREVLHVHVAIDTGMHRLGIRCENIEEILSVYGMAHLAVDGIFTHLAASDSAKPQDRAFTDSQVQAFYQVVDILENRGHTCRGLHLLASYGILNLLPGRRKQDNPSGQAALSPRYLSDLAADYVRPGIALYGVLSTKADSDDWREILRPVLSLKAKVISVRKLYAGEAAGYGMAFTAGQDMRIATLSIGYADGLPRELSGKESHVLINGRPAPVIGRICMDQTIVDVSNIPNLHAGDTAVIIGKSGAQEVTADSLAQQCGTITNELLSRLGARLERFVLSEN